MSSGRAELLALCDARPTLVVDAWNEEIQNIAAFAGTPSHETRANAEQCFEAFLDRLRGQGDGALVAFVDRLAERRFSTGFEIDGPIAAAARFRDGVVAAAAATGRPLDPQVQRAIQAELDAFNSGFSSAFAARLVDRSENRLRELFEHASDLLMRVDAVGRVLEANRRFEELLGHPREAWLGRPLAELVSKPDRDTLATLLPGVLGGQAVRDQALHLLRADGSQLRVELSAHVSRADGASDAIVTLRDVTEARALRAQVIHAEKLASIGQLAASTAHELNNPLTWVFGNLEQCIADLAKLQEGGRRTEAGLSQVRDMLREALTGTRRMAGIVRDLRTYAGAERDDMVTFDLREVVDLALRIAGTEVRGRAQLQAELADAPKLTGHPGRISQVLVNLLVNAVQAHPEDRASDENIVRVTTRVVADAVEIEVRDNGRGITDELRARMFEPFVTTKGDRGTGLGLWVARNIVEHHDGELSVDVEDGWTRFVVRLPVRNADTSAPPPVAEPAVAERRRVLVIDDEAAILRVLDRRLRRQGMDTVLADGGAPALKVLEHDGAADEFDAIVCDLGMPGMSGVEFHQHLARRWPALADRVLFLSGAPQWQRGETPRPCFDKPLGVDALISELAKLDPR